MKLFNRRVWRIPSLTTQLLCTLILTGASSCSIAPAFSTLMPPVLSPASFGQTLQINQQLVFNEQNLLSVLSIQNNAIQLVGLSPLGQRLYSIHYDGQTLQSQSLTDQALPARLILAQLQFALWPSDTLTTSYPNPWQLISQPCSRQLRYQKRLILTAHYCQRPPSKAAATLKQPPKLTPGTQITIHQVGSNSTLKVVTLSLRALESTL